MSVVHLVCMALAGLAAAATVAAGPRLRRTSGGVQVQFVGLITATALVVGNAVCVLPGTPGWYSMVLITATAAGLGWLVTTLAGAMNRWARQRPAASVVVPGTLVAPTPAQPLATVHELRPVPTRATCGPELVTAQDLYDAGPAGSRAASSSTVYVATNLPAYVAPSPIERRNRPLRAHTRRDPAEAMRRLRVAQAYNHTPARESRVRHSL